MATWIKATKVDWQSDNDCIEVGDRIKIYGKETVVKGFSASFNDGLGKWETIIITEGRGDPFERSLDVIEIIENYNSRKAPILPVPEDVKAPSNIVEQLSTANPYRSYKKTDPEYVIDRCIGWDGCIEKMEQIILSSQPVQGNAEDQDDDDELEDKIVNIMCESIEQDFDYSLRGTEEAARKIINLFKNK